VVAHEALEARAVVRELADAVESTELYGSTVAEATCGDGEIEKEILDLRP
jgi:hypothetical protein